MTLNIQRTTDRILTLGDMGAVEVVSRASLGAAGGWWDNNGAISGCWAAYAAKGAASLAASYTDLSGNGNDAGVGVAPTWDAVNGWKFNGTTQYLTTTFVPQNDQSQSMIVQYTNGAGTFGTLAGSNTALNRYFFLTHNWSGNDCGWANGTFQNMFPKQLTGNLAVAGSKGYRNGIDAGIALGPFVGPATAPLWIGATNNSGAPSWYGNAYIQALAIYDCTLTAPQVLAVANAMALL